MSEVAPLKPPEITDEDIRWAARLLGLPENAFHGEDGNDPRLDVLKCMNNLDIAACPGSGKTTLLVAKLAVLANKWKYRTRGICVLSHTNAARREIEKRLGGTAVGRQLLTYPHYIGTIHGFVDRFLALPWLRSKGYHGVQFNSDIAGAKLWEASNYGGSLPGYIYRKFTDTEVRKAAVCHAHYVGEERDIILESGNVRLPLKRKNASEAFTTVDDWKQSVLQEGFASYEDTFAFGHCALREYAGLSIALRERFPVLFIDEAQDNSEEQSKLLHHVFMDGESGVLRQRFGDSNQAIYNFVGAKGATTDAFPDADTEKSIPNSHRFGATIARLAEPLGVDPHDGGLKGNGPRPIFPESRSTEGPHTIFLFQDDTIDKVMPAYAELLIETFSEEELEHGVFTAVGQVHNDTGDDKRPRHVGHYWPDYDSELTKVNPQPQTFVQYVRGGQEQAETTGETYPGIEKIAQGILRLAGMAEGGRDIRLRRRSHRYVLDLLEKENETFKLYQLLLSQMIVRRKPLAKKKWDVCWMEVVRKIGQKIAGVSLVNPEADSFLSWPDADITDADGDQKAHHDNLYRYPADNPKVHIKVGSIHSVKGQTHTATLVLETFWHEPNLQSLKEWLVGKRCNGSNLGVRNICRLKLHYVGMTRPTHLLCLAMKRNTFDESDMEKLQGCGWSIKHV